MLVFWGVHPASVWYDEHWHQSFRSMGGLPWHGSKTIRLPCGAKGLFSGSIIKFVSGSVYYSWILWADSFQIWRQKWERSIVMRWNWKITITSIEIRWFLLHPKVWGWIFWCTTVLQIFHEFSNHVMLVGSRVPPRVSAHKIHARNGICTYKKPQKSTLGVRWFLSNCMHAVGGSEIRRSTPEIYETV